MIAALLDRNYVLEGEYEAEAHCGEDFCDSCGDCLHCFADDPCPHGSGNHVWYVYADDFSQFAARHPEAVAYPAHPVTVTSLDDQ